MDRAAKGGPVKFHRRLTALTGVAVACYLGWVFGSRWWYARQAESRATRKFAPLPAALSGSELKILHFYASPAAIPPGGRALLCYGVLNAATVVAEPAVEGIGPSISRCVEVRPARSTEYKLTATGAGATVGAATRIEVR